jgi:hypothetical protein
MLDAQAALSVGMVDRIATFEQTLQRGGRPQGKSSKKNVESLRRRVNLC